MIFKPKAFAAATALAPMSTAAMGVVFGTLTFGIVFQGIKFITFDKDLNLLFIGALLLFAVLMNETFRRMATNWSATKKS